MAVADDFAQDAITFAVLLSRYEAGVQKAVRDRYELLIADLRTLVQEFGDEVTTAAGRVPAMNRLISRANGTIDLATNQMEALLGEELTSLAETVTAGRVARWNAIAGGPAFAALTATTDLSRLVEDVWFVSTPLDEWWGRQATQMRRTFADTVRAGVLRQQSDSDIIKSLMGRRVGSRTVTSTTGIKRRVGVYGGGILSDVSRRNVGGLVRTAVHGITNSAIQKVYDANADVLRGMQTLITLDLRTSDLCMSRDQASWDMEGKPLPESPWQFQFPGPPPWHFRCRTILIPILKKFSELGARLPPGAADQFSAGSRSALDGVVAAETSISEWLRAQSTADIDRALGPGRRKLWEAGAITLRQLANESGKSLTLGQLRALTS